MKTLMIAMVFLFCSTSLALSDDEQKLVDTIWNMCENETSDDNKMECFDYYNNCILNNGKNWQDSDIITCAKDKK